jgi:hypothetical protein
MVTKINHYRDYNKFSRKWFIVCDAKTDEFEEGLTFELSRPWNDVHTCPNCDWEFELKDLPPFKRPKIEKGDDSEDNAIL